MTFFKSKRCVFRSCNNGYNLATLGCHKLSRRFAKTVNSSRILINFQN